MTVPQLDEFVKQVERLNRAGARFALELRPMELIVLISTIQLACRHPNFDGPTRLIVEDLVRQMARLFKNYDTPAIHAVLEKGWDPQYDQGAT